MDGWPALATVLWTGFALALVLGAVGVHRSPDRAGLTLALVASAMLVGFSYVAALSIGPLTMALPALITALAAGRGLPRTTWSFVAALAAVASWLVLWSNIASLVSLSPLLVPLFCAVAYLVAFVETGPAPAAG
jgi:hypothetical protein